MRPNGRENNQMREIALECGVSRYAEGSCLIKAGHTHVLCTASVDNSVPPFLRNSGKGWVTAEYGMLPRATHNRNERKRTLEGGRTQEISRLIGRSFRAVTNLTGFGERQIRVDCDVIQADGGTRTAAINGGYVALALAFRHLQDEGAIESSPLIDNVAAISCGLHENRAIIDLDYAEDSNAQADANFVMSGTGKIIEIQGTAEKEPFAQAQFLELLSLAQQGTTQLTLLQQAAIDRAENGDCDD